MKRFNNYIIFVSIALVFLFVSCDGNLPDCVDLTPDDEWGCDDNDTQRETCNHEPRSNDAQDWLLAVIDPISKCWFEDEQFANSLQEAIDCSKEENPGYWLGGIFFEFEIVDFYRLCEFWILDMDACDWVILLNLNDDYALQCAEWSTDSIDGSFMDYTEFVKPDFCRGEVDYGAANLIQESCAGD